MPEDTYELEFADKASYEFDEAYAWYEEQQSGLGEQFAEEIKDKLNKISLNPYHYKNALKNIHEAVVERFPFLITFTIKEKYREVVITAVFHTSRNPKTKYRK